MISVLTAATFTTPSPFIGSGRVDDDGLYVSSPAIGVGALAQTQVLQGK